MTLPCSGRTTLFFSRLDLDVEVAKAICATCPHQDPCLAEALGTSYAYNDGGGVWAGTEPPERRAMRRAARERAAAS